ncbi:MAG TPA: HIT family protein [Candidatus Rubrimentiphilum sp.]|nr:HIT family protein [Candidatus Rubrimentiphilum sp.]
MKSSKTDSRQITLSASPFLDRNTWINENEFAVAVRDIYPVAPGHTLILPKRIVSSIFDLGEHEILACWQLLGAERERLTSEFNPDGFNVGVNVGTAAGQTVGHAHIHLIPRYHGDHPAPRGGIRAVMPGKADYEEH